MEEKRFEGMMEGTNEVFSTKDLDNLIDKIDKIKEQSKWDNFTRIVKGVARKYSSKWVDKEDLEQDLWVEVLTLVDSKNGNVDQVDEKLVARVCWNKAVDKYRYERRRYELNQKYIEGSDMNEESGDLDEFFDAPYEAIEKIPEVILYKEVIEMYPVGSRQRRYVVMRLVESGLLDMKYLDSVDRDSYVSPSGNQLERDYLKVLGYTSHAPGSWIGIKRQMNVEVREFLGYNF